MSPTVDAADLRAAALSDHRHASNGLLEILLPDVPGEPFGGYATPEQRYAVHNVTGRALPTRVRVSALRNALRRWAEQQAGSDNAAGLRGTIDRLQTLDASGHPVPSTCECDWEPFHHNTPCRNDPADHGPTIRTSPSLCTPCLYVCCAERDDAAGF